MWPAFLYVLVSILACIELNTTLLESQRECHLWKVFIACPCPFLAHEDVYRRHERAQRHRRRHSACSGKTYQFYFPCIHFDHYSSFKNQAAVNGIRASGATTQLILAEGLKSVKDQSLVH